MFINGCLAAVPGQAVLPIFDMFRKETFVICGLVAAVFIVVAIAGFWVGHTIREDADRIALDTLPGLVDAGAAMAQTQENWLQVHLLPGVESGAKREALIQQIRSNSNEGLWRDYGLTASDFEERREYGELLAARTNFVRLREEFFALVKANHPADADALLSGKLGLAYKYYNEASRRLFEYNAKIGRERAARVVWISRACPLVLGVCGVLVFSFGMAAGLRGALGGLRLVTRVQKHEKRAA